MKGKTRIWIGMTLLFVSGIAVGFFGSGLLIKKHVREFVERGPAHMNARTVHRIIGDMDLTDSQRAEIDSIVARTTPEMRELSDDFRGSMDALVTSQFDSIKAVLGEEKTVILEKRIEEIRDRMRHRSPGRGPGRGRVHDMDDRPPREPRPGG